jgi:hypothetical protein
MLETLDRPLDGLAEIKRILKPGGVLGVACVEYGGLILTGPNPELLRRFYAIRERVWLLENTADPYRGRQLRGLLERAGFVASAATWEAIPDDGLPRFPGAGRANHLRLRACCARVRTSAGRGCRQGRSK